MSATGDILEDLESGVAMLLEGAWTKIKATFPNADVVEEDLVYEMGFSVLCALHERIAKQQIIEILLERIIN